jgi:hypothetical protein
MLQQVALVNLLWGWLFFGYLWVPDPQFLGLRVSLLIFSWGAPPLRF